MSHNESHSTLALARQRFDHIAAQQGIRAPEQLLDNAGAPSAEVMRFRKAASVSLDYLFPDE